MTGSRIIWEKRGRLFRPCAQRSWVGRHAALPVAVPLSNGRHRVYFSSRDTSNRSHIGSCDADLASGQVLAIGDEPCLSPGALGAFDDAGVTTSCIVEHRRKLYLYYSGWSLGVTVPFYLATGLAVGDEGGLRFERVSPAPLLDRNDIDPFLNASPWVLIEAGVWRMWYVSATAWTVERGHVKHHYLIKYAESVDGMRWRREGRVCVDYATPEEHAIARPCVLKDGATYRMWFSCRGDHYRLGYAESPDGIEWTRLDHLAGMTPSLDGWDSEMIAYPFVISGGSHLGMLYNGNGYGRSGFGYAMGRRA